VNDGDRPNVPKLFNLRTDPVERADITSSTDWDWMVGRGILVLPASALVGQFLRTCKDFPPRQKAASFTTIDQAVARLEASRTTGQ
jgi:arylsulfatase